MRQGKDDWGGADIVIRCDRDGQHRKPRQAGYDNLNVSAALVARGALLEAVVQVGGLVAIRLLGRRSLERHGRPGLFHARLRNSKTLGEEQRSDKQSGGTHQGFAGERHV